MNLPRLKKKIRRRGWGKRGGERGKKRTPSKRLWTAKAAKNLSPEKVVSQGRTEEERKTSKK